MLAALGMLIALVVIYAVIVAALYIYK